MPEVHAKLSASGSSRWINCPGSIALESNFEDTTSPFAQEGTKAHEYAENWLNLELKYRKGIICRTEIIDFKMAFKQADSEMFLNVESYVNECLSLYDECLLKDKYAEAYVEVRVDFSKYVPEGFGTVDFCVVTNDIIYIRDLKYGKGVQVSAKGNSQLRLYGIGAYLMFDWIYDFKKVNYGIIQPRLNHLDFEELEIKELLEYMDFVKGKANETLKPNAKICPGSWCKFCKARSICKVRSSSILNNVLEILERM